MLGGRGSRICHFLTPVGFPLAPTAELLDVLLRNPWFAGLPEALRGDIVRRAKQRSLKDGEALYHRSEAGAAWYGVLAGAIKVSNVSPAGKEMTLTYLEPGAWFGEISIFDGQPRTHDGRAQGPTDVLVLAREDFDGVYAAHPAFARALLQLQCQRLRLLFSALEEANLLPLEQRLAKQLLSLAGTYGRQEDDGVRIDLHLPQDALAQLLGTSRQRVNQALKSWERDGLLRQRYGQVVICNPALLRELAQGHDG
jgi:CRP/FNR family transcriptional regulator, cyclic AMP receptor protein